MAARRLIILMVLLLAASTIAAALAPQSNRSDDETTTTTEVAPPDRIAGGELVRATIDASAEKPRTLRIAVGDQLALVVRTPEPAQIEIPEFGLLEDAERDAPARFDLLAEREGMFSVQATTLEDTDRVVGTLAVSDRADEEPAQGS